MDIAREGLDVLDGRGGQDAMAQIEDVSRPSRRAVEDVVGGRHDALERAQQDRWIEVPLHGAIVARPAKATGTVQ